MSERKEPRGQSETPLSVGGGVAAAAAGEPRPAAWLVRSTVRGETREWAVLTGGDNPLNPPHETWTPLYAHPPSPLPAPDLTVGRVQSQHDADGSRSSPTPVPLTTEGGA